MRCYEVKAGQVRPGLPVEERVLAGRSVPCVVVGERGRGRWEEILPVRGWSTRPTEPCPQRGGVVHVGRNPEEEWACPDCGAACSAALEFAPFVGEVLKWRHPDCGEVAWRRLYAAVVCAGRPALAVAEPDSEALVLARAAFGFRGASGYRVNGEELRPGHPAVVAAGRVADGAAGRVAAGDELLLILRPGDRLRLWRTGRLYGAPEAVEYRWDGAELRAATPEEWAALEAADEAATAAS